MDFRFTTDYLPSQIDEIVAYLLGPRLWIPQTDYPDFLDWAQKAHQELRREKKRAIVALSHNQIVGVVIYQHHRQYREALELKNLTVRPDQQGRYIASFLLRNAEVEGMKEFGSTYALCDAKAYNFAIRMFLLRQRYLAIAQDDLYHHGAGDDIVYRKDLHKLLV